MSERNWHNGWKKNDYGFLAPDGCNYDSPAQYFWGGVLGFCGCYSGHAFDVALGLLWKLYEAKKNDGSFFYDYKDKSEDFQSLQEVILHVFDSKDLTEHGGSVRGCWLDEKGWEVAKLVFETKPAESKS